VVVYLPLVNTLSLGAATYHTAPWRATALVCGPTRLLVYCPAGRGATMRLLVLGLCLIFLMGCAAFEQTPQDVQKKLSDPTKGKLYERDPLAEY
jgi:hypothetical protein